VREQRTRQATLLKLVRQRPVASQEEMVQLLEKRGFHVTQASVSRDVRELGLVRVDGRYVPAARVGVDRSAPGAASLYNELIVSAEAVGANLIVVKTPPGAAATVAVELDSRKVPEMAGTVAGDDTIFVAVRSRVAQGRVLAQLKAPPPADGDGPDVGAAGQ
jgi:transcriptional regulator of arginine metabolism